MKDSILIAAAVLAVVFLLTRRRARPPLRIEDTDRWTRLTAAARGKQFELWCAELLRRNGFHFVRVSGRAGDQGVDIVARHGLKKYAIQCKCYTRPLGNKPVQEINAGMEIVRASVGAVMTNSTFTKGAVEAAKRAGRDRPILLWDRVALAAMCGQRYSPRKRAVQKKRKAVRKNDKRKTRNGKKK